MTTQSLKTKKSLPQQVIHSVVSGIPVCILRPAIGARRIATGVGMLQKMTEFWGNFDGYIYDILHEALKCFFETKSR